MKINQYIWRGLAHAASTLLYIGAVSWFMWNAEKYFDKVSNFLIPFFMLMLFVVSATITGLFVLGKPLQMYVNNKKKEALELLLSTVIWLIGFTVILILLLLS